MEGEQLDAEAKLAKVKKAKDSAAAAFASMKASGLGGVELNREMYIKLEEEIAETRAQLKVRVAPLVSSPLPRLSSLLSCSLSSLLSCSLALLLSLSLALLLSFFVFLPLLLCIASQLHDTATRKDSAHVCLCTGHANTS